MNLVRTGRMTPLDAATLLQQRNEIMGRRLYGAMCGLVVLGLWGLFVILGLL